MVRNHEYYAASSRIVDQSGIHSGCCVATAPAKERRVDVFSSKRPQQIYCGNQEVTHLCIRDFQALGVPPRATPSDLDHGR